MGGLLGETSCEVDEVMHKWTMNSIKIAGSCTSALANPGNNIMSPTFLVLTTTSGLRRCYSMDPRDPGGWMDLSIFEYHSRSTDGIPKPLHAFRSYHFKLLRSPVQDGNRHLTAHIEIAHWLKSSGVLGAALAVKSLTARLYWTSIPSITCHFLTRAPSARCDAKFEPLSVRADALIVALEQSYAAPRLH